MIYTLHIYDNNYFFRIEILRIKNISVIFANEKMDKCHET